MGNNAQLIPLGEPHNISSKTSTTAQVSLIGNNGQLVPFEKQRTISPEITETTKVNVKQDNQSCPVKSSQTCTQENSQWNSAGNLRWRVRDNTLTISGKGNMDNYSLKHLPPWGHKHEVIRRVVVKHGVTSIGNGAFFVHTELKTITLPETIKTIGASAFFGSGLKKIKLPNSVKEIDSMAFASCMFLTEVKIPYSVTSIGINIFSDCYSLKKIYCPANSSFKGILEGNNAQLIRY